MAIQPTTLYIDTSVSHLYIRVTFAESVTYKEAGTKMMIPFKERTDLTDLDFKIAAWTGTEFEVLPVRYQTYFSYGYANQNKYSIRLLSTNYFSGSDVTYGHNERNITMYYPIDSRMIESDIHKAKYAYPNDDNTGWLFSHTTSSTHHDYELRLRSAVDGVFQPVLRQYQVDAFTASSDERIAKAKSQFVDLSEFYGEVLLEAIKEARKVYLGEREQKPHPKVGYLDYDITTAIDTVEKKWKADTKKSAKLTLINTAVVYAKNALNIPDPKTRWALAEEAEESED